MTVFVVFAMASKVVKVNPGIQENLEHLVNVVLQEKRVNEAMLVHKVIPVMLVQLVHLVAMELTVSLVAKVKRVNQLVFRLYKACQEKRVHQVFPV